ncbi:MFS transporter [Neofusicoccum parvum]|nr:MFS transporter [Neofusicoccum parvum]
MNTADFYDVWPPGTIQIQDCKSNEHELHVQTLTGRAGSRTSDQILLSRHHSDDPDAPLNWSKRRKYVNFGVVCFYTLMAFVLLDIGTVIWASLNEELGITFEDLNNSFAANTAGLAVGCILFIPVAIKFGRRPVYIASCAVMLASAIWQAKLRTTWEIIVANVMSGLAGAVSESIVQMTIADLFYVHQRATVNSIYVLMVSIGTFLAPVAAGYSAVAQGWRWIWWWSAIFLSVSLMAFVFLYEESKYIQRLPAQIIEPIVVEASSKNGKASSRDEMRRQSHAPGDAEVLPRKGLRERFAFYTPTPGGSISYFRLIYRFLVILVTLPAVAYTALIYGSLLSWFSIVLTTLSTYFAYPPYNFDSAGIGLLNLAPFAGCFIGSIFGGPVNDWLILYLSRRNGGIFEPEMRLWMALPGVVVTPAGILLYGYSLAEGQPWIIPCVGLAFFGLGFTLMADTSLTYAIDCYQDIIGDALVGVAFVRNGLATVMVFALTPWVEGLGLQGLFLSVGCLALAINLTTIPIIIWGKTLRQATANRYHLLARHT